MNIAAIQHRAFDNFCYPLNEDELEISLLTAKDVESVVLVWGDPFSAGILGGNWQWNGVEVPVTEKKELQSHYRWSVVVKPEFKRIKYYFKIKGTDGSEVCYFETGFVDAKDMKNFCGWTGCWIFPWMNPGDVCKIPTWPESTVWYQIFPSRFCRGKSDFIPKGMMEWPKDGKKKAGYKDVYGGNLQGIIDRLDYLKELGISGLYLTPVNESPSQHKYDTTDYEMIDRSFGDSKTMKELVQKAHERGIRIVLDGVFNHCGWANKLWQDVWENRQKSKYASWFMINDFDFEKPSMGYAKGNAGKGKFYSFAFADGMPKLNTNNPEVRKYIIDICEKWVKEYDIDGLRLDVANEISHVFCRELNKAMKALKSDFYIVGEIWHNSLPWLRGDEFDSVMNYPLQNGIADFCVDKNLSVKEFEWAINRCYSMYYKQVNRVLFNQMDSHDTIRILNRCGNDKNLARGTLAMMFAMPGAMCIYYGSEIMLEGEHDPDNRRCMPWTQIDEGAFAQDFDWMKQLIALRKNHNAMVSQKMDFVYDPCDAEGKNRLVHLVKVSEDGMEKIHLFMNCGEQEVTVPTSLDGSNLLLSSASAMENGNLKLQKSGLAFIKE